MVSDALDRPLLHTQRHRLECRHDIQRQIHVKRSWRLVQDDPCLPSSAQLLASRQSPINRTEGDKIAKTHKIKKLLLHTTASGDVGFCNDAHNNAAMRKPLLAPRSFADSNPQTRGDRHINRSLRALLEDPNQRLHNQQPKSKVVRLHYYHHFVLQQRCLLRFLPSPTSASPPKVRLTALTCWRTSACVRSITRSDIAW